MEKTKLFNLAGKPVEYESWKFDEAEVLKAAKKFFGFAVTAYPCFLSKDSVWREYELGWTFDQPDNPNGKRYMVGFLGFDTGFKKYGFSKSVRPCNGLTFMGCTIALEKGKIVLK